MSKASPITLSFNAGEFSALLDGRTDLERYSASARSMYNYIGAPQGPAVGRPGTAFVAKAAGASTLIPFVFSEEQARVLEFSADRIRFFSEDGLEVYDPQTVGSTGNASAQLVVSGVSGLAVGDEVALSGYPAEYNVNGTVARVLSLSGANATLDTPWPAGRGSYTGGEAAKVYAVPCVYTVTQRANLRHVQSVNVVYLLTEDARPRKLSRFGSRDWRLEELDFTDGPYMPINETPTVLEPLKTGDAVPAMTSNTTPLGTATGSSNAAAATGTSTTYIGNRVISHDVPASQFYFPFDGDPQTYWHPSTTQEGNISYGFGSQVTVDGYAITVPSMSNDPNYLNKDFGPSSWSFEGSNDGTTWAVLDVQKNYVLYEQDKTVFFKVTNPGSYSRYRLVIGNVVRNGPIEPRIARWAMRSVVSAEISITSSSVVGINDGLGFMSTDVGRLLRMKGSDGTWRPMKIIEVTSPRSIRARLLGEPFPDISAIRDWRLGYWSDTTGYPGVGHFFEDRLYLAGSDEAPDMFAGSVAGDYENFQQVNTFGEVLEDNAVVGRLNSRRLSRIKWIVGDNKGLLLGTGSEEFTLRSTSDQGLNARSAKARRITGRGSAAVEPLQIDNQALFVQRGGRAIRELAFVFEADGYKAPSMSQLASHVGVVPFEEMVYASEPHSVVWVRRADGSLVGLTYNREENVVGWHRHDLSGGKVKSMAVIPARDGLQDVLWLNVERAVNGQTVNYIERLTRFWDFDSDLEAAHFVDSGLRYIGTPIQNVYGLQHLEGQEVYGVIDRKTVGPLTVVGGLVELPYAASEIVLGLGYDGEVILPRINAGARDGTSQGKVKRINSLVFAVWKSYGGQVGVYNAEAREMVYDDVQYPRDFTEIANPALFSGMLDPVQPAPGYDLDGIIGFRRPKGSPLPFNVTAIMPQLHTQDR